MKWPALDMKYKVAYIKEMMQRRTITNIEMSFVVHDTCRLGPSSAAKDLAEVLTPLMALIDMQRVPQTIFLS